MKKLIAILTATAAASILAFAGQSTTAQASWSTGTKTLWTLFEPNGDPDWARLFSTADSVKAGKNGYVWNYSHTKRIHNLKNYPNTTWYAVRGIAKNKHVYYRISNPNSTVKGLVWSGYVKPYATKTAKDFKTADQFNNYLQTEPSQKLTRAVLRQLPNIPVSFELSKYAAYRFAQFPKQITNFTDITTISTLTLPKTDFASIKNFQTDLNSPGDAQLGTYWALTYGQPVNSRAEKIIEALNDHQIDLSQFDTTNGNWRIGVNMNDGQWPMTLIIAKETD